jgi:hypothetical protein
MVNIIPTNDFIQHTFDPTCICQPGLDFDEQDRMLVFHSFVDSRTKSRLPIKKRWETINDNPYLCV